MWKKIENSNYYISNTGELKNKKSGKLLNCKPGKNGYKKTVLILEGKRVDVLIHRLVAQYFVSNSDPSFYNIVNHKNGNKLNNSADNLEWTSYQGNNIHAAYIQMNKGQKPMKEVIQMTLDGKFVAEYPSINSAARANKCDNSSISKVCRGKAKTCNGYIWKYKSIE